MRVLAVAWPWLAVAAAYTAGRLITLWQLQRQPPPARPNTIGRTLLILRITPPSIRWWTTAPSPPTPTSVDDPTGPLLWGPPARRHADAQ